MNLMQGDVAISVMNLSKMYKLYSKPSDMFWEMVTGKPQHKPFWALRDVTFEVRRGQVVGVVGRNGAGKSTLLKIITGTLDKTSGEILVNGRISSILELGTGFNAEYTGRENILLGGLMVGLTREEINQKLGWIIEFSELGDFIDQPFKTYSSGMQARLAFSTAVCIEPEILIIDEVLAVGDAKFSHKCYGKIEEFRQAGHTILLVSHDLNTISLFCNHAIYLEGGQLIEQGEPQRVTKVYYQKLFCEGSTESIKEPDPLTSVEPSPTQPQEENEEGHRDLSEEPSLITSEREALRLAALRKLGLAKPFDQLNSRQMRMGNQKAEILNFGILDSQEKKASRLTSGEKYTFFLQALFYENVEAAVAGFVIRNIKGMDMYGTTTRLQKLPTPSQDLGDVIEARLDVTMWLTNGYYFLSVAIADPYAETDVQYDLHYDAFEFEVKMKEDIFHASAVDLDASISYRTVSQVVPDATNQAMHVPA